MNTNRFSPRVKTNARHGSHVKRAFVGFMLGDVHYAVPIERVREIVNPLPLTELPHAPPAIAGVADHRGEVIPVIDLRTRFGLEPQPDQRRTKWVLVRVDDRSVGLRVDRVTEVFGQAGEALRPAPSLGAGDDVRGLAGVITHEGKMRFVLDLDRIESLTHHLEQTGLLQAPQEVP